MEAQKSKTRAIEEGFFVVGASDLKRLRTSPPRRASDKEREVREFLAELGFYTGGSTIGSKIYERLVNKRAHRLWLEVTSAEGYFSVVLGLNSTDPREVEEVVEVFNAILEREATSRGYKRVV
jgi:hypothetical protein